MARKYRHKAPNLARKEDLGKPSRSRESLVIVRTRGFKYILLKLTGSPYPVRKYQVATFTEITNTSYHRPEELEAQGLHVGG